MSDAHDFRPDGIRVFGDQHRAQALGCAGAPGPDTPDIERGDRV